MMNSRILMLFTLMATAAKGQPDAAEKARNHIFQVLTTTNNISLESADSNLQALPWEALAYLDEQKMETIDDLEEAVPDYYYFHGQKLHLKLIDPNRAGEYGTILNIPYRLVGEGFIQLLDPVTKDIKDSWKILYLDKNYLALDMGGIRVFFNHTSKKD